MITLNYKRSEIKFYDGEVKKVYSVLNKDNSETLGYFENDEDFGWIFFESVDHEWFGGFETLKEAKSWIESFNNGKQIITKLINK